ncbi:TetR/AcrR family transcriptional regulator [Rhodococcus sp. NPDC060176]|uniref:TetR/AcrR family transcriptional regulator n=1 Tax=Rhodococcus sp. NPDC060176 TaxID=3347062 RepID=UPI0036539789
MGACRNAPSRPIIQRSLYLDNVPKIVDPQRRREEVLDAVWRVIQRDGLGAATIRAIATEAGASTAVVTYYFKNKDDVLKSALGLSHARIGARRERKLAGKRGLEALNVALLQTLPLDAERRLELHIEVSFWARAISDDAASAEHLRSHQRSLDLFERLILETMQTGEIDDTLDSRLLADELLALVDGMGVDALMHPKQLSTARMKSILRDHLARLHPDKRASSVDDR